MRHGGTVVRTLISGSIVVVLLGAGIVVYGQSAQSDPVARAAEALGGRGRLLSVRTLTVEGYGQLPAQNGGGNLTTSPDAPMKWTDVNDYVQVIDLANNRMRVRQTQAADFVAATLQRMRGTVSTQAIDGDVAFNIDGQGRATRASAAAARDRRMEMHAHPIVAVRAALDPKSKVSNRRSSGGRQLVDVTIPQGDTFTLAVDDRSGLPAWVSWVGPDANLGDVTYRAHFTGYEPVSGLRLPTGINTTMDFRGIVQWKLHIDRHAVDAQIPDLAAPDAVRAAPPQVPRAPVIEATQLAKGVWFLAGQGNSTLFEFDDHLTLFEAYGSEANGKAIIAKAKSLVPGKPLTELIISHHHFDHTGGFRAAVAEGLTIIAATGNEDFLREIASRPAKLFPDALGPNPRPVRIRTVDDHLKLKDGSMEIDVYRVMANSHMADALMVHMPRERLLSQGDLFDVGWGAYWWGTSYIDNVRYRKIEVERDVPVHGRVLPFAEVQQLIARQIKNAQDFCAEVEAARLTMRGCPVKTTVDR
jgi:glyoxylase-like metal-dependent hydrolase (beta-lactamase superfamily II)